MKQFITSIFIAFLAGLFLISTAGIGLYQHYCSCEGSYYTLAAAGEDCCHQSVTTGPCCQQIPSSGTCCETDLHESVAGTCGTANCCSTELVYLKLDTDLTLQINQEPIPLPVAEVADLPADPTDLEVKNILATISHETALTPLSGRSLLTFLHQLRLEAPVA